MHNCTMLRWADDLREHLGPPFALAIAALRSQRAEFDVAQSEPDSQDDIPIFKALPRKERAITRFSAVADALFNRHE